MKEVLAYDPHFSHHWQYCLIAPMYSGLPLPNVNQLNPQEAGRCPGAGGPSLPNQVEVDTRVRTQPLQPVKLVDVKEMRT